jgi:hypothetical protein
MDSFTPLNHGPSIKALDSPLCYTAITLKRLAVSLTPYKLIVAMNGLRKLE